MTDDINGTVYSDTAILGRGAQTVNTSDKNDLIVSYGDAGEPDPAQTIGDDGRYSDPVAEGAANDTLTGGGGADRFVFTALINATQEVITQHTTLDGVTDWGDVAGENDNVHDHWVEGFGLDTITDYSEAEGDSIVIKGHTATISSITYGVDEGGSYSLISVISQQGNGGAGGANTETGAHDEDSLGQIKVYGDTVTEADITVENTNDGIDQLDWADTLAPIDGAITQEIFSATDGTSYEGSLLSQREVVYLAEGSQSVDTGGGNDRILSYSDGGEPDPAQTDGAEGRVNPAVADGEADDVLKGGQGQDSFGFRLLLNAKQEVLDEHTRNDGTINWRKVAGENDNVHDHWVEGIGNDVILDFSNQDGDTIDIRGHTVEIAEITYGEDDGGDYSLIVLRSQQGDGGGAHDEDLLGTIKVYGDQVTEDDISVTANVFDGVDQLEAISIGELDAPAVSEARVVEQPQWGAENPESIDLSFQGTDGKDVIHAGSGSQTVDGGGGADRLISYGDAGEPDPAQTDGAAGRINPALADGVADDVLTGGKGGDRFEFHALLNATAAVIAQHTENTGAIDWQGVAGENDDVHNHWVEGFGNDTITDFSKSEGDTIIVRGHTASIAEVTYGSDAGGSFSLIRVISQQGDGGAGGANTETGAHDEDPLGTIKVYGDKVVESDIVVQAAGVFDGVDYLDGVDALRDVNGGVVVASSSSDGSEIQTAPDTVSTVDYVEIGSGSQTVSTGAGNDRITSYADAGEPDPAQTIGADGRYAPAVDPASAVDVVSGGQGEDVFAFNALLNATSSILARHTLDDGSIDWRSVAGENDVVHDHWVEGIGDDVVLDYSNQDGDSLIIRGHTVEIINISYGVDELGDFSLVSLRSQQGDGGGAHDEDPLGTLKIYGDTVEEGDIEVQANVFDGIDIFEPMTDLPTLLKGDADDNTLVGTKGSDNIHGDLGNDILQGKAGADFLFGHKGKDILKGGSGSDFLDGGLGQDSVSGGSGADTIHSAEGKDTLAGGADADTFVFYGSLIRATVTDWEDGIDIIDFTRADNVTQFSDLVIEQVSDESATLTFVNDDGENVNVEFLSANVFTLTEDDFLF